MGYETGAVWDLCNSSTVLSFPLVVLEIVTEIPLWKWAHKTYNSVSISTSAMTEPIWLKVRSIFSIVYSGAEQRKQQSSASLRFIRGNHRWPVKFPHKGPVMRKMFPFHDILMRQQPITWTNQWSSGTPDTCRRHQGWPNWQCVYCIRDQNGIFRHSGW